MEDQIAISEQEYLDFMAQIEWPDYDPSEQFDWMEAQEMELVA